MTRHRKLALVAALAASIPARAYAEPYTPQPQELLHLKTPTTGRTDGGTDLRLPPGYFLDEPLYTRWDAEIRRLQDAEVRLRAENQSLRKSAQGISFGWKTLAIVLVVGVAVGAYGATR